MILRRSRLIAALTPLLLLVGLVSRLDAQSGRVLGREDIQLYGLGLKVEPATQTVPKDIATIVSTFLQAPSQPSGLPPFAPDAEVVATLRGPSFQTPVELRVKPNSPFNIPPLTVPGTHVLENVRLVSGGEILLRGVPDHARIEVIEKLLVTQVTARALTAAEIREKGIVYDKDNFQAYNFSAAFAVQDQPINLSFPVVLPRLQGAQDAGTATATLPSIGTVGLPSLQTIIPDTLKIQTRIPNLSVVGFTLQVPALQGQQLVVPPIPGVVVIPGDIGFLNQYFSVMLMVGNVAPAGSNLVVTNLQAQIVLPPGNDQVTGSADDPLRMAQTTGGEAPRQRLVAQPGPDGKVGTADDIPSIGPGESGNAEYLVEGRREGSHVVEMQMTGTLNGLPVGPVTITGRAAGAVLVRNPKFTLTFTHPEVVSAGEPYTLDVTVTNTSSAPANFVSLNLYPRNVSGATIIGDATRGIESLLPSDSETVSFNLVSKISGKVTAATLDSDSNVQGQFSLKTAIGELGVPLSPESLVLPKEASGLPADLRSAVLGLLGKAHAVATAPAAALPPDVRRFSRKIVIDRAIQAAEAGLRVSLGESLSTSAAQLLMDYAGSDTARLETLFPKPEDRAFELDNMQGFDELRRRSVRGDRLADAVSTLLAGDLAAKGATQFLHDLAQAWSYRPGHVALLLSGNGLPLPARASLADTQGRRTGPLGADGKITKEIPYSDVVDILDGSRNTIARLILVAAPQAGTFTVPFEPLGGAPANLGYVVSLVAPDAAGELVQTTSPSLTYPQHPEPVQVGGYTFTFSAPAGAAVPAAQTQVVVDPPPGVVSVLQQSSADVLACGPEDEGVPAGRVVAVLFSEEVTAASVQDRLEASLITGFTVDGNKVVGVALQPGRRVAYVALRDPFGPFVPRQMTISGVQDMEGHTLDTWAGPITPSVPDQAGVVSGRVLNADGTPVPFANVRLFSLLNCGDDDPRWIGISSKPADANGRYQFDYVTKLPARILAVNQETGESRNIRLNVQRDGQRLNVDIVYLGRGTLSGTTYDEQGRPLARTALRVSSLTDGSEYGTQSDEQGRFTVPGVPVGNFFVEAVNLTARAEFSFADYMPGASTVLTRDITLLNVEQRTVTVKHGALAGHVLRADGTTPVAGVPVIAWYQHNSQPGVRCPGEAPAPECAVAMANTDGQGGFSFPTITAGQLRLSTFDQGALSQGEARVVLPADGHVEVNVLLGGGLGTVTGLVLDNAGQPVAGASVGGGLSLTTTAADGSFTLSDVPVGRRDIVAVSQALGAQGRTTVDLLQGGQTVNAIIRFEPIGSVAGTIVAADGVTPVPNVKVYLFKKDGDGILVAGSATANSAGGFQIPAVPAGTYELSAFNASFTDGNIVPVSVKFQGQTFRTTIRFRGAGGRVSGRVLAADGATPLKARVAISGDQVAIAGGQVGVAFQRVQYFNVVDTDLTTGAYSFSNLWVGPVTVSAVGQFSPEPVSGVTTIPSPGAQVTLDLKLQDTSQITGVVYLPNGVQPAAANLIVKYKSEAFTVICSESSSGEQSCQSIPQGIQEENAVTDEQGRFWFPLVNPGPFTITVEEPAGLGRVGKIQGTVRPGETADLSVRLLALGDVTVRVRGSNTTTPIPGARLSLSQLGYPQRTLQAVADAQGVAHFSGGDAIAEGGFVVTATDPSNGFAGRARGTVGADGQPLVVDVYLYNSAGTVAGTLYGPDGTTPVANAEVIVSSAGEPLAYAVTDGDGRYSVSTIPLGPVAIDSFEAKTGRRAAATGRIDLNNQQVTIDLVQAGIGMVRGTVLDAGTRQPLKAWEVVLYPQSASGLALPALRTTTGIDGAFSFPGTGRGSFTLTAAKREVMGRGTARGWVEQDGQVVEVPVLVDIQRQLRGGITGVVLAPGGGPAANAAVEICLSGYCGGTGLTTTAAADGTFTINDVPLGRFSVVAREQVSGSAGSAIGEIAFEGDVPQVTVVLSGLARISGRVVTGSGAGALARVTLEAYPSSGCAQACSQDTSGSGDFAFVGVPGRTFTVTAVDLVSGLKGVAGGSINPGEQKTLQIVLEPTAAMSGRILRAAGLPALGAVAELVIDAGGANERRLYAESNATGTFAFPAVPTRPYELHLSDPIGPGVAHRTGTVAGPVTFGDIVLDEAPPQVASLSPAASSSGANRTANIVITFTEPIQPGTINGTNVTLTGPDGVVTGTLDVTSNDTVVVFDPLSPLKDQSVYTLRVKDVLDRVQKPMPALYSASFTTEDITPPAVIETSPVASAGGVTIYTPIRVTFSEAVDTGRFTGAPIAVTSAGGAIAGVTSYLNGNRIVVFTPNLPLGEGITYQVNVQRATDLAGLQQAAATSFSFSTTTRIPPTLSSLTAVTPQVVEGGVGRVAATPSPTSDVLFVDFYVNGVLAGTDRTAPFEFAFQATPAIGAPGAIVAVTAVPTDTSGNRGVVPASAQLTIVADQPPTVTLNVTTPTGTLNARNGDHIVVELQAADDVGLSQLGYRAATGNPIDALTRTYTPAAPAKTESFAFTVPAAAAPGTRIAVQASGVDTKGQVGEAATIEIVVVDAVAPVIQITGATSGTSIRPGQPTTVVVTANDLGGVAQLTFTAGGLVTRQETRTIDPAQNAVVASFTVNVPSTAQTGDVLTLDATATDRSGNTGAAARVILPIADGVAPTVSLQTSTGSLNVTPGQTLGVVVTGEDAGLITELRLAGTGAMTFSTVRQVSPPLGSASRTFDVLVPATLSAGQQIQLTATAVDASGNVSAPATIVVTATSGVDVTLPASQILGAGETVDVAVTLGAPAGPGGLRVDFAMADPGLASVTPFLVFAEGETSRSVQVTGLADGTTLLRALVQQVPRASMTVTVAGGVVTGVVYDSQLVPVGGAQLTISGGGVTKTAFSGADGRYSVSGIPGPFVSVRALHPDTRLRGYAAGSMVTIGGTITLNVVLIPAGAVEGTVVLADGVTPAGSGVQVDIFERNASLPLATTFTDADSQYAFPLVTLGQYTVQATALDGRRGRATLLLSESGEEVTLPLVYIGTGTLTGTVKSASGNVIGGAQLKLQTWDAFGAAEPTLTNADGAGAFTFVVPVGSYSLDAIDQLTGQGGSIAGTVTTHLQQIARDVVTASYASLHGRVLRADGVTPVAGARVTVNSRLVVTDENGDYRFEVLPLGSFLLKATDPGTNGMAQVTVSLSTNGADVEQHLQFAGQGRLLVTVRDANGLAVPNAFIDVAAVNGPLSDRLSATTGADGTALIERVLSGSVTVVAGSGALSGSVAAQPLAAGQLLEVLVTLEGTGTIQGVVYGPDGQAPAQAGRVQMDGPVTRSSEIASDGTYRLPALPKGRYRAHVYDGQGRLRARTGYDLLIETNGQVVVQNFVQIGFGRVSGRVAFSNNDSAQGFGVSLRSDNPLLGGAFSAVTNAGGIYQFDSVPVGAFRLSTGDISRQVLGEGSGVIATDGQALTVDIVLQNNAVNTPVTLFDGNGYWFEVARSGTVDNWGAFGGTSGTTAGASQLTLLANGTPAAFSGEPIATVEDAQREVALREAGLHGLTVTRKVFVPADGYFSRELELLTNPGSEPITVDVSILSSLDGRNASVASPVVATSSGDDHFSAADDGWVVFGQWMHPGVPGGGGSPARAFVMQGASAGQSLTQSFVSGSDPTNLTFGWSAVTVPPGQTVALLHFIVQQTTDAAARASAERLAQLPPEALQGLSADEIGAIVNFTMPAGGVSQVEPLPPVAGSISGQVLEGDGTTPVPSATVSFTSSSPLFGRTFTVNAGNDGRFTLTANSGGVRLIPRQPFTLRATYPQIIGVVSPETAGDFLTGNPAATQNVAFTNTGMLTGVVRRATNAAALGSSVRISGRQLAYFVGPDASYRIGGLPPGDYTVTASVPVQGGGTALTATGNTQISAASLSTLDLVTPATYSVTATITRATGSAAVNLPVSLRLGSFERTCTTSTGGTCVLADVPAGNYTLSATEPVSGIATNTAVAVVDRNVTASIALVATGSVTGTVTLTGGGAAVGRLVQLRFIVLSGGSGTRSATTSATGEYRFDGIPASSFSVEVTDSVNQLYGRAEGQLTTDGQTVDVDFVLSINTVTLPTTLFDANGYNYEIRTDGTVEGLNYPFGYEGANMLRIFSGSYEESFYTYEPGVRELGNRQVKMTATMGNGMKVSRKVFVPQRGYFSRFVDTYYNPTDQPMEFNVQVLNDLTAGWLNAPEPRATSSGDLDVTAGDDDATRDMWVAFDDPLDADPFVNGSGATALGILFGGPQASMKPSHLEYDNYGWISALRQRWDGVTIAPGQSLSLMHFMVQQTSRAAAKASLERLVQLPPEAIEGLTVEERATIVNFVVPANGQSTLPALGDLTGAVNGQVTFTDGTAPYSGIDVSLKSSNPLFSRTYMANTNAAGQFSFTSSFVTPGSPVAIALDPYDVTVAIENTGLTKRVQAQFPAGQTSTTTNVVLDNAGSVTGALRRGNGQPIAGVFVSDSNGRTQETAADGSFTFVGLPAGSAYLYAEVQPPAGEGGYPWLYAERSFTIVAGARTAADLALPAVGGLSGIVLTAAGQPAAGVSVEASGPPYNHNTFSRWATTDAAGRYRLTELLPGAYTVQAYDGRVGRYVTQQTTVAVNSSGALDFTFQPVGRITATVTLASGQVAQGAAVDLQLSVESGYAWVGTTDGTGRVVLPNVPAGQVRLRAGHPQNSSGLFGYADATVSTENENVPVSIVIPAAGTVTGRLTSAKGQPLTYTYLYLVDAATKTIIHSAQTDQAGNFTFAGVPVGLAVQLAAEHPFRAGLIRYGSTFTLSSEGDSHAEDISRPALANLAVRVTHPNGESWPDLRVQLKDSLDGLYRAKGTTNSTGQLYIGDVPEGPFTLRFAVSTTGVVLATVDGEITPEQDQSVVLFPVEIGQFAGMLSGTVFAADGVTPIEGITVRATDVDSGTVLASATTSVSGAYTFSSLLFGPGGYRLSVASPFDPAVSVSASGTVPSEAAPIVRNLTLPVVLGSVAGTARAADGRPVAGVYVDVADGQETGWIYAYTDENGQYRFDRLMTGAAGLTLRAFYPGSEFRRPFTFTTQGQQITEDFTLDVARITIQARVLAGDSQTPVRDAEVFLEAPNDGGTVTSATTDADGRVTFDDFWVPTSGVVLTTVYQYSAPYSIGARSTTATSQSIDLMLPMSVIKGTVRTADGEPVDRPTVFVEDAFGSTQYARRTTTAGEYVVFGTVPGAFRMTAQDRNSGVMVRVEDTMGGFETALVRDLSLPPFGRVTGRMTDAQGAPVTDVEVQLTSGSLQYARYTNTDSDGRFTFEVVPAGDVIVYASRYDENAGDNVYWSTGGTVVASATVTIDLPAPPGTTVAGLVTSSSGVPQSSVWVRIQAYGGSSPLGYFERSVRTGNDGRYSFAGVPIGPIKVTTSDSDGYSPATVHARTTASPLTVDLEMGTAVRADPFVLSGQNGVALSVNAQGSVYENSASTIPVPLQGAFLPYLQGNYTCCDYQAAVADAGGRQVTIGPFVDASVLLTRKVFMPEGGQFIRFLEIVENTAPVAQVVSLGIEQGTSAPAWRTRWVVLPTDTGKKYMVMDQTFDPQQPPDLGAVAYVINGAGTVPAAARLRDDEVVSGEDNHASYSWQVNLPAGARIAFLHFGVVREPADAIGAEAQAIQLVDLSDPAALAHLTAEERAMIRNFNVP